MKYPLENLTDVEFENLVALICKKILGEGTIVFSEGKDGGKDANYKGTANCFPSESEPWSGKIIIQAKHTQRPNASCTDSEFQTILRNNVIPSIRKLIDGGEIEYYLLFTNRKLSGVQFPRIEDFFNENVPIENRLIGLETIELWLRQYPDIVKTLNLNKLLLPLNFNESDLKEIVNSFSKLDKKKGEFLKIPEYRDIEQKNVLNQLSKSYFDNAIKKNVIYFQQIREFLMDEINLEYLNKYHNTIDDINAKVIMHRADYDNFERILEFLYDYVLETNIELTNKRRLVRLFLHYMYYNCDIGINE